MELRSITQPSNLDIDAFPPPAPLVRPDFPRPPNPTLGQSASLAALALRNLRSPTDQRVPLPNPLGITNEDVVDDAVTSHKSKSKTKKRSARASRVRRRRREEGLRSEDDPSSSDSSDSLSDERLKELPCLAGEASTTRTLPPKAQEVFDAIELYRAAGWLSAIKVISRMPGRPIGFPFSLFQPLLRGFYICPAKVSRPDEYDSKKIPRPTEVFTSVRSRFPAEREWRRVMDIIKESIIFAFPCSKAEVESYFRHIYEMANLFADQGDWSHAVDYDSKLRMAFATRPHLTFANFDANELVSIRNFATAAGCGSSSSYRSPNRTPHQRSVSSAGAQSTHPSKGPTSARQRAAPASGQKAPWAGNIKPSESAHPSGFLLPSPRTPLRSQRLTLTLLRTLPGRSEECSHKYANLW